MEVLSRLKKLPTTGDTPVRIVTMAVVMAAAMRPYSMAVTPSSF